MLNKAALMRAVAKTTGLSFRDASASIDVIIETVGDCISRGGRVELRGLGSFSVKQVPAKKYPSSFSTQKSVIPSHGKIVFRPCQKLRESVWNSSAI